MFTYNILRLQRKYDVFSCVRSVSVESCRFSVKRGTVSRRRANENCVVSTIEEKYKVIKDVESGESATKSARIHGGSRRNGNVILHSCLR